MFKSFASLQRHYSIRRFLSLELSRANPNSLDSVRKEKHVITIINAFVQLGMVNRAVTIFNKYRRTGHVFSVSAYNTILSGWVKEGDGISTQVLFENMQDDGVSPDFTTYATMLEFYSKCGDWNSVEKTLRELSLKGFKLENILHEASLVKRQAQQMLKIMARYNIVPKAPEKQDTHYPEFIRSLYKRQKGRRHLNPSLPETSGMTRASIQDCLSRQLDIEEEGFVHISSITNLTAGKRNKDVLKRTMYAKWKDDFARALDQQIEDFFSVADVFKEQYVKFPQQFPFLALLPGKVWAQILVDQVIDQIVKQPNGMAVSSMCWIVGNSAWKMIMKRSMSENECSEKVKLVYYEYLDALSQSRLEFKSAREVWEELDWKYLSEGSMNVEAVKWSNTAFLHVGASLLDAFLSIAMLPKKHPRDPTQPAFEHVLVQKDLCMKHVTGQIRPTNALLRIAHGFKKEKDDYFAVNSSLLPMLVPPRPWTSTECGGYALSSSGVMRIPVEACQNAMLSKSDLGPIYDALNYVSSCPWIVNKKVLDLVIDIFNGDGNEAIGIPSYPYKNENLAEAETKGKYFVEQYSMWMDMFYRISLCNHYRDDIIWLPHNMDFRGRSYPIPPHISHITMDAGRALLVFANGYPLGDGGLNWLKLHLMNLYGIMKKDKMEDRLAHAHTLMDEIHDSAKHPRTGRRWWEKGSDPFQVLACCIEISNAVDSGDPSTFISHLPVHQDGSCNGLQHYSALGRDSIGAKMVNLTPSDKPEDTYGAVAQWVEERRKLDAESGNELAPLLEGKISRKLVKQTVMTTMYGVTRIGARKQVQGQLRYQIDDDKLFSCSIYVTRHIFDVLGQMFQEAKNIQAWLVNSAKMISYSGYPVEWRTPLGLCVIQPYHKSRKNSVKSKLQLITNESTWDPSLPPNVTKQKCGFPPNYIHSLDSTHMMMTALGCMRDGIPFVAVHDSYWTNARFVDELNQICRKEFVSLHKQPVLQDLSEFFEEMYGNLSYKDPLRAILHRCNFTEVPSQGDLDLESVLKSKYFFS